MKHLVKFCPPDGHWNIIPSLKKTIPEERAASFCVQQNIFTSLSGARARANANSCAPIGTAVSTHVGKANQELVKLAMARLPHTKLIRLIVKKIENMRCKWGEQQLRWASNCPELAMQRCQGSLCIVPFYPQSADQSHGVRPPYTRHPAMRRLNVPSTKRNEFLQVYTDFFKQFFFKFCKSIINFLLFWYLFFKWNLLNSKIFTIEFAFVFEHVRFSRWKKKINCPKSVFENNALLQKQHQKNTINLTAVFQRSPVQSGHTRPFNHCFSRYPGPVRPKRSISPQFWASDTSEVTRVLLRHIQTLHFRTVLRSRHVQRDERVARTGARFRILPLFWTSDTHELTKGSLGEPRNLHLKSSLNVDERVAWPRKKFACVLPQFWASDTHEVTRGLPNPQARSLRPDKKRTCFKNFSEDLD